MIDFLNVLSIELVFLLILLKHISLKIELFKCFMYLVF